MSAGISLWRPSAAKVEAFLNAEAEQPFTYPGIGLTRNGEAPSGWFRSYRREKLGEGAAIFARAAAALHHWKMFELGWVEQVRPHMAPEVGTIAGVLARAGGLWLLNACRVVYTIDEHNPRRVGFAYGTLPGHVEQGEERFLIEQDESGGVWYDIFAFSRPAHWLARLGHPYARRQQRRFADGSIAAMKKAIS